MASTHVSMSSWAKRLQSVSGDDFKILLKAIASPVYVDETVVKTELALLNTNILKLLRSSEYEQVWKGCHAVAVVCSYNPLVLVTYSGQMLVALNSKLDQLVGYFPNITVTLKLRTLLETLVSTMSCIIDLMRSKATLSRESLVPALKVIIPVLIKLTPWEPKLTLKVLKNILSKHTNTFKPFATKYTVVLGELIERDYTAMDKATRKLVCDNFAYLHLIKVQPKEVNANESHNKPFPDATWRQGILSVISEFKSIVELFPEFLDFEQDSNLKQRIQSLPTPAGKEKDLPFLKSLSLDMNEPFTLYQIQERMSLLADLLIAFMSNPTPFPIRVPMGAIHAVSEVVMSITTKYLPIKRELRRDGDLSCIIDAIIPQVQFQSIRLWTTMVRSFGKCCLSITPEILASLEYFIPVKPKTNQIDFDQCNEIRFEFQSAFQLINLLLEHMGHQFSEVDPINKFIDVALHLSEDTFLLNLQPQLTNTKNDVKGSAGNSVKKNKRDSGKSGAVTDLYTNPEQFKSAKTLHWMDDINRFLTFVVSNWQLASNEQIRVTRYVVSKALSCQTRLGYIPKSFKELLRCVVIHPNMENASVLPIVVSLLKDSSDDVFDMLCHPRLPLGIVHAVRGKTPVLEEDVRVAHPAPVDEHKVADLRVESDAPVPSVPMELNVRPRSSEDNVDKTNVFQKRTVAEVAKVDEEMPQKRVKINDSVEEFEFDKNVPVHVVTESSEEVVEADAAEGEQDDDDDDDDDEFIIPEIELSDADDEE